MATVRTEHFILQNFNSNKDLEFYLNDKGEIFAHELGETGYETFFTIS